MDSLSIIIYLNFLIKINNYYTCICQVLADLGVSQSYLLHHCPLKCSTKPSNEFAKQ